MDNQIICGEAMTALKSIPDNCVHTCVTSPPYYGLRDYGSGGQIGLEKTPEEYITRLVAVFSEVKRILRDDGTLWVNIGDSYAGSGKGSALYPDSVKNTKQGTSKGMIGAAAITEVGWGNCKPKDLIGVPWSLAFALRASGWYLRQDIIWHKPNPMPESVKDRCTKAHEYIFLLSKSKKYYFDSAIIKENCSEKNIADYMRRKTLNNKHGDYERIRPDLCRSRSDYMPSDFKRNKRDVWTMQIKPHKGAHFATYPVELITPCILAGCPENGIVLDPFCGSGTTGVAAAKLKRKYILIDINAGYVNMAKQRLIAAARQGS